MLVSLVWLPVSPNQGKELSLNNVERLERIMPLVRQAASVALGHYGCTLGMDKSDGTLVTAADKEVEAILHDGLKTRFPGETIVGEENGCDQGDNRYLWSIDPIDGTAAYINRLPHWGVSVGLFVDQQPTLGVVYMPVLDEMYWGAVGQEATMLTNYWGKQRLACSTQPINKHSLIMVPSRTHQYFEVNFVGKLRSLGSTVAHVLMVARGDAAAAVMQVYQWDLAACIPILLAAGGVVGTLDGSPLNIAELLPNRGLVTVIAAASHQHLEAARRAFVCRS